MLEDVCRGLLEVNRLVVAQKQRGTGSSSLPGVSPAVGGLGDEQGPAAVAPCGGLKTEFVFFLSKRRRWGEWVRAELWPSRSGQAAGL